MADLVSLDDYKSYENLTGSENDEQLEKLIPAVSALVKTYCGSSIIDDSGSPGLVEEFDIQWDTYVVQPSEFPVISVSSVEERAARSSAYEAVASDEYYLDPVTGSVFRTTSAGTYTDWPKGVGSVRITYTAGYTTTPTDLQLAVIDLINYFKNDEHIENRSQGPAQIEFISERNMSSFPPHIKRVLDLYKIS